MKLWVTGAGGMLGQDLMASLAAAGVSAHGTDREVDITQANAVAEYVHEHGPFDWIINCAAYTAVDKAESEPDAAYHLNATGPKVLASAAHQAGAALLHISTDYVFDGAAVSPYTPGATPAPQSEYGRTKLAGEEAVRASLQQHVILRTAWLYGAGGPNFVKTMLRLMNERDSIRVVADQHGTPTWARDLASAICTVVTAATPHYGTYHFTNSGPTTWYEFAVEIYRQGRELGLIKSDCTVEPIPTKDYPTPAPRPAYSVLSCAELEQDYGMSAHRWQESLTKYLHEELHT